MTVLRLASAFLLAASLSTLAAPASAQAPDGGAEPPRRMVSLLVGGFGSDIFVSEAESYPTVAVRTDWRLSRYVLAEVGTAYTRGRVELANRTGPVTTYHEETGQVATATVGLQAELPLPYVRPYVGIASGLFLRLDPPGGDRFVSTTQAFPLGVRVPLTERLGARLEARIRYDEQMGEEEALGGELTAGMSWRF
jgi:hypothetical protein